jgi:predicted MFS family arabinose efflux permease
MIAWGTSYYLLGGLGDLVAGGLGWHPALVHGGLSAAMTIMAASSPLVGRLIDSGRGQDVLVFGCLCNAIACAGLSLARTWPTYYAAWACLGVGMRMSLYDAAFATVTRADALMADEAIVRVTLLGGLASSVFWPLGRSVGEHIGWRGALMTFAACSLANAVLLRWIFRHHSPITEAASETSRSARPVLSTDGQSIALLYAIGVAVMSFSTPASPRT